MKSQVETRSRTVDKGLVWLKILKALSILVKVAILKTHVPIKGFLIIIFLSYLTQTGLN
jgi:hypothetical protein